MKMKALVRCKKYGNSWIQESDVKNKSEFLEMCKGNGLVVKAYTVKPSLIWDYIHKQTNASREDFDREYDIESIVEYQIQLYKMLPKEWKV